MLETKIALKKQKDYPSIIGQEKQRIEIKTKIVN